jgi:hypothetical protein
MSARRFIRRRCGRFGAAAAGLCPSGRAPLGSAVRRPVGATLKPRVPPPGAAAFHRATGHAPLPPRQNRVARWPLGRAAGRAARPPSLSLTRATFNPPVPHGKRSGSFRGVVFGRRGGHLTPDVVPVGPAEDHGRRRTFAAVAGVRDLESYGAASVSGCVTATPRSQLSCAAGSPGPALSSMRVTVVLRSETRCCRAAQPLTGNDRWTTKSARRIPFRRRGPDSATLPPRRSAPPGPGPATRPVGPGRGEGQPGRATPCAQDNLHEVRAAAGGIGPIVSDNGRPAPS